MCQVAKTKPAIVCVDDDPTSLQALADIVRKAFGVSHDILCFTSRQRAMEEVDARAEEKREIALILCDRNALASEENAFLEMVHKRCPETIKVLLTEQVHEDILAKDFETGALAECILKPWVDATLTLKVRNLLSQYELGRRLTEHQGALERRAEHLEALHRVGVRLAGSFDIDAILRQIGGAAAQLMGDVPIDIFYAGSSSINARSRWYPSSSPAGHLCPESRHRLVETARPLFEYEESADDVLKVTRLQKLLLQLPDGDDRELIPISGNGELLGLMVVKPPKLLDKGKRGLLSILGLQAATALHNIHLTQERIHFERLSAFGKMIGSLVHDFRSPLTAIRGYVGMLAGLRLGRREREEYSKLAIEECDRLNGMIDELLEFTRGGRSRLELRHVSLGDYLQDLIPAIRAHFKDDRTRVEMMLDYDGGIDLDPNRMNRAVLNVASNASQAMNGSGAFLVRTERRGDKVIIEFQDTGSGIPEEICHRIFEPFFSYGKPQGIGLGMSITRKIVEEHGGTVSLTSEVGHGTRVRFVLPLKRADSDAHQESVAGRE